MFTKEEIAAIVGLMDAGIKMAGLNAMRPEVLTALDKLKALNDELGAQRGNGLDTKTGVSTNA